MAIATVATAATKRLIIDPTRCQVCTRCLVQKACRGMAVVRFDRDEAPVIDSGRCYHCLLCIDKCPHNAVIWA